ncbi:hypothetical protein BIFGAL_04261 [Bifidobacterium gallicum DSM 20093 = LMG 11596]|nr:hypothetical protein BIFGAL_04261 [Bifidobacterium gallicum DSM 20093 = LMG 11596]
MMRRIVALVIVALFVALVVISVRGSHQARNQHAAIATSAASSTSSAASSPAPSASSPSAEQSSPKSSSPKPSASSSSSPSADPKQQAEQQAKQEEQRQLDALAAPLSDDERSAILASAKKASEDQGKQPMQMVYCVSTKGNVGSADGFADTVYRVLNNEHGWPRSGVVFTQGDESNCTVTITLSQPELVPSFSEYCSPEYSCRVGSDVIINKKRWDNAVDDWLKAGGNLAMYRTMVINHEMGHALGHRDNETTCAGEGKKAPLMQEQSMFLKGCVPNPYPLDDEQWTTFVGPNA